MEGPMAPDRHHDGAHSPRSAPQWDLRPPVSPTARHTALDQPHGRTHGPQSAHNETYDPDQLPSETCGPWAAPQWDPWPLISPIVGATASSQLYDNTHGPLSAPQQDPRPLISPTVRPTAPLSPSSLFPPELQPRPPSWPLADRPDAAGWADRRGPVPGGQTGGDPHGGQGPENQTPDAGGETSQV